MCRAVVLALVLAVVASVVVPRAARGSDSVPSTAATANDCPKIGGAGYVIDLRIEIPPVTIHRGLSVSELGDMAFHGPKSQVLGLTKSGMQVETSTSFRTLPFGDAYCYWVDRVDIVLRYNLLNVYIADKYPPGSCPYDAILTHERKHVTVARENLERLAPQARAAFAAARLPNGLKPGRAESLDAARGRVDAELQELTDPLVAELGKAMETAQAPIDTPEEYAAVRRQCSDW